MPDDDPIHGIFNLWTFPLLNALVKISSNTDVNSEDTDENSRHVETAKVIRDSNGEIQEIVVIKE